MDCVKRTEKKRRGDISNFGVRIADCGMEGANSKIGRRWGEREMRKEDTRRWRDAVKRG